MPCLRMTRAAMALRSTIDSGLSFFASSLGMGVVLAQTSLAPVFRSRATIVSRRCWYSAGGVARTTFVRGIKMFLMGFLSLVRRNGGDTEA